MTTIYERTTMPDRTTTIVEVKINLDPVPGAMHTPESVREIVQQILTNAIPHYDPQVITM